MKFDRLAVPILAISLATPGLAFAQSYASPAPGFGQAGGWDVPPQEFKDIQRQGYHDGIEEHVRTSTIIVDGT